MSSLISRRSLLCAAMLAPVASRARAARVSGVLKPVRVSPDRVIRTIAGLRPFRPSGFVVRGENIDGKVIVHNYGHGGAGITLSWGTAHLAALEAARTEHRDAAVIGGGVSGLTAARILLERGFRVTIYAREFAADTTSGVAGGQWFPFTFYDPEKLTPEVEEQFVKSARYAYNRYQTLVGPYYGIRWLTNYQMSNEPLPTNGLMSRAGPMAGMMPEYADLPRGSHPFPFRYARQFDTMFIEPPVYLETMMREVRLAGASIENREFHNVEEMLALPQKLIVNCTGLGARSLFEDEELTPIKGQLTILLPQSEVEYATLPPELYMFPRRDGIVLGGTHERGVWDTSPDENEVTRILTGHRAIFEKLGAQRSV
jgi:glycine/D-amino acid oxidase-like deaminating enzyme